MYPLAMSWAHVRNHKRHHGGIGAMVHPQAEASSLLATDMGTGTSTATDARWLFHWHAFKREQLWPVTRTVRRALVCLVL